MRTAMVVFLMFGGLVLPIVALSHGLYVVGALSLAHFLLISHMSVKFAELVLKPDIEDVVEMLYKTRNPDWSVTEDDNGYTLVRIPPRES